MGVLTIKARKPKAVAREAMMEEAHQQAHRLLDDHAGRVLVVYEKEAANIYFEGQAPPKARA